MSPEQVRGAKDLDARSDLWALGVIVFRCLTGRLPFNADVIGAVIGQILADPIPTATSVAPDLPPEIDAFFARVLVRDREGRYASARDMANALSMIAGLTPRAMSMSAAYFAPAPVAPPMQPTPQPWYPAPPTPAATPAPSFASGSIGSGPLPPPQAYASGTQAMHTPPALTPASGPFLAPQPFQTGSQASPGPQADPSRSGALAAGTLTSTGGTIPAPSPRSGRAAAIVIAAAVVLGCIVGAALFLRTQGATGPAVAKAAAERAPTTKPAPAPAPTAAPAPVVEAPKPAETAPAATAAPSASSSAHAPPAPLPVAPPVGEAPAPPPSPAPQAAAPAHKPASEAAKPPPSKKTNLPPVGFDLSRGPMLGRLTTWAPPPMPEKTRLVALALLAAAALAPSVLHAAPPDDCADPKVAARALAEHGYALYEEGKYPEAVEVLTEADKLYHAPTLVFAIGRARAASGKLLEAKAAFQRVVDEPIPPNATKAFRDAQRMAKDELAAVDKRIPSVQIAVHGGGAHGLRVTIDDADVAGFRADQPVPVNPGTHRVTAVPFGGVGVSKTVDVAEGAHLTVDLELAGAGPAAAPPAPPPPPPPPPARGSIVPAIVGFGVGAFGFALGIGAGVSAKSSASDLKSKCGGDVCPSTPALQDEYSSAKSMSAASTAGFVIGGIGAAAGVVLIVLRPGGQPASVGVAIGPSSATLTGRF